MRASLVFLSLSSIALGACGARAGLDVPLSFDAGLVDAQIASDASVPDAFAPDAAPCPHECVANESRCDGDALASCVAVGDGCTQWRSSACAEHQDCVALPDTPARCACVIPTECANTDSKCSNGIHVTCPRDGAGCAYVSHRSSCAFGCALDARECVQIASIASGYLHSCSLLDDGTVRCWGYNAHGQIGNGSLPDAAHPVVDALRPVPVTGLRNVTAIGLGFNHSCAVVGGGAQCWGDNSAGQLGDRTTTVRPNPVIVVGLTDVRALAGGFAHTCALHGDGTIECWGAGELGQLGNGAMSASLAPVPVQGIANAQAISGGENHTCALLAGGAVKCWGANASGQLGDGSRVNSPAPVFVRGVASAVALSQGAASTHTCAVLANGDNVCWGDNSNLQIGDGTKNDALVPKIIGHGLVALAAGRDLTCGTRAGKPTECWGYGNLAVSAAKVPTAVAGTSDDRAVAAGWGFACVLERAGEEIDCWGGNLKGELGRGDYTEQNSPKPVQ